MIVGGLRTFPILIKSDGRINDTDCRKTLLRGEIIKFSGSRAVREIGESNLLTVLPSSITSLRSQSDLREKAARQGLTRN
jgi:hypothetical protein